MRVCLCVCLCVLHRCLLTYSFTHINMQTHTCMHTRTDRSKFTTSKTTFKHAQTETIETHTHTHTHHACTFVAVEPISTASVTSILRRSRVPPSPICSKVR